MVQGRRVTDGKTIEVTVMVLNGLLNTQLLAMCKELDINAVGYSGVDAGLVTVHKRAPVPQQDGTTIDYGFVGDVDGVNPAVLRQALDAGFMPVVSPLCADAAGNVLNVNADTVAAAIGAALGAEKLLLCTSAPGILENIADPRSIVSYTDLEGLAKLHASGSLADGMLPKALARSLSKTSTHCPPPSRAASREPAVGQGCAARRPGAGLHRR